MHLIRSLACLAAALGMGAASGNCLAQARATSPVQLTSGLVVGTENAGVRTFLGLPYAAPPVGALRWRAPQPWSSTVTCCART
jgi:para-nitrobenzyl esterase